MTLYTQDIDVLPDRNGEWRDIQPLRVYCKTCDDKRLSFSVPTHSCAFCGGQIFLVNCNIVLVGDYAYRQALKNVEWRKAWADRMRDKHPNPV